MSTQTLYRQGDIMLQRIEPEDAAVDYDLDEGSEIARENGKLVIALGEVTGHSHVVEMPAVKMIAAPNRNDKQKQKELDRFLISEQPFAMTHDEHAAVHVPAGLYRIVRQQEYAPGTIRNSMYVTD